MRTDRRSVPGLPSYLRSWLALVFAAHFAASLALGAELRLREAILQAQRDRVTATFAGTIDHIGDRAHGLAEDCDLHVPCAHEISACR